MRTLLVWLSLSFMMPLGVLGQELDTLSKRKGNFLALPALAYTPETGFTFGAVSEYYFDFSGNPDDRMSKVQLAALYTTKKQMYFSAATELFSKEEKNYLYARAKYSKFIDRDYGVGNDASAIVVQYNQEDNEIDTLNYRDFFYQSAGFEAIYLRRVANDLMIGGHYWFESLWDVKSAADSLEVIRQDPDEFNNAWFRGNRSGFGLALNYDTRKNSNNPLDGTFIQFRNWYYRPWLGSDFNYTTFYLDARHYINTVKDQTLALRFKFDQRYPHKGSYIPKFDMGRVGGREFARGYYDGTYLDNHLMAWEIEYRLPLFVDYESSFFKFWKRIGVVAFASGTRTFNTWDEYSLKDWRYTVGFGGRYLLSAEQRINIRLDIGWGLHPISDYNKRHVGVYAYISEAF